MLCRRTKLSTYKYMGLWFGLYDIAHKHRCVCVCIVRTNHKYVRANTEPPVICVNNVRPPKPPTQYQSHIFRNIAHTQTHRHNALHNMCDTAFLWSSSSNQCTRVFGMYTHHLLYTTLQTFLGYLYGSQNVCVCVFVHLVPWSVLRHFYYRTQREKFIY